VLSLVDLQSRSITSYYLLVWKMRPRVCWMRCVTSLLKLDDWLRPKSER